MSPKRYAIVTLAVSLASVASAAPNFGGLREAMFPSTPDVIVNTDVIDSTGPQPTPNAPIYYLAAPYGYRDFGFSDGGEKVPEPAGVRELVTKILDGQGYKAASAAHPPNLILLYSWGTFCMSPNPGSHSWAEEMLEFMGGEKLNIRDRTRASFPELATGLRPLSPNSSTVEGFLPNGLYVVTFWAFDYPRAMKGEGRLYWKTNISASRRGFYLPEVLPTMLAVAAPMIGRETGRPVRVDVGKQFKPSVEIGPLRVIEDDVKTRNPNAKSVNP
ncbi:MAG TPA: hypothetical protein VHD32_09760 [Candidatus Didemnitutus sp.]|nr:hypothetical protein [Candidatus Didemnitutus sp.]